MDPLMLRPSRLQEFRSLQTTPEISDGGMCHSTRFRPSKDWESDLLLLVEDDTHPVPEEHGPRCLPWTIHRQLGMSAMPLEECFQLIFLPVSYRENKMYLSSSHLFIIGDRRLPDGFNLLDQSQYPPSNDNVRKWMYFQEEVQPSC